MTTLADLREMADQATPGPWRYHWPDHQGGLWPIEGTGWAIPVVAAASVESNARYIAECSPERMKALIAVAEMAERLTATGDMRWQEAYELMRKARAAIKALRAALASPESPASGAEGGCPCPLPHGDDLEDAQPEAAPAASPEACATCGRDIGWPGHNLGGDTYGGHDFEASDDRP